MAEKGSSEGSVYFNKQRKNWIAQYYNYDIKTGNIARKTKTFKTEEEAKKYLDAIMYQKENPLYIKHNGIPLCKILKQNLNLKYNTNQIGAAQYGRVLRSIEQLEKVPLGSKNIDDITADELQEYLNSLKDLSNSMIEKAYQQLNQAFNTAINKGYITQNPMKNIIRPKSNKEDKEVRALTVEEQQQFTSWLINKPIEEFKYRNVFLIQMYTGLRVGEALALTTHDIDLAHKRINIHRTLTTDEKGNVIMGNKTKTYSGKRTLPIPDFLYPYIVEQMKIANEQINNEEKLLFKPYNSKYCRRSTINNELQRIFKKEFNVTDISSHSLRHTFGTRCIESGMAPVVVQRLMGHKNIAVTLNTYTSVFDKFKENEIDKVNQYYLNENLIGTNNLLNENNKKNDIENEK